MTTPAANNVRFSLQSQRQSLRDASCGSVCSSQVSIHENAAEHTVAEGIGRVLCKTRYNTELQRNGGC